MKVLPFLFVTHTVFTRIDAAAFISFFAIQLRRLFEGGVYSSKYGILVTYVVIVVCCLFSPIIETNINREEQLC